MRALTRSMQPKYTPPDDTRKKTSSVKPTSVRQSESEMMPVHDGGVDHVVLLKINARDASKLQMKRLRKGAYSLTSIDGVKSVQIGQVYMDRTWMEDRTSGFNYYLRLRLKSVDHLKSYQDHPLHRQFRETCIDPILLAPPLAVDCTADVVTQNTIDAKMAKVKSALEK